MRRLELTESEMRVAAFKADIAVMGRALAAAEKEEV